jgi:uncharacterized protein (TIGR02145 family)
MASNVSAKNFFELKQTDWINNNWDSEFDTIWWKLYTWTNSASACPVWWNVPSDTDWTTLENTLNWSQCRTWNWWQCDWLWWKQHNLKTDKNNLANALKIPLSGYRRTDGSTFGDRGFYTYLWSSVSSSTRDFHSNFSGVSRYTYSSKDYWFSVRCIKD